MKVPQIEKRTTDPPVLLGKIKIDLRSDVFEGLSNLVRSKAKVASNENQLQSYFAHFLGIGIQRKDDLYPEESWIYSFTVIDINNETGAEHYEFLGPLGLIPWLLIQPTVSVTIEGSLTDARSGTILSESKVEPTFKSSRSYFTKRVQSLPMIEVAAVNLLKDLKGKVPF